METDMSTKDDAAAVELTVVAAETDSQKNAPLLSSAKSMNEPTRLSKSMTLSVTQALKSAGKSQKEMITLSVAGSVRDMGPGLRSRTSKRKSFQEMYAGGEAAVGAIGDIISTRAGSDGSSDEESPEPTKEAAAIATQGTPASVFTLANTLIGLGLLKMPQVCAVWGIIPFFLVSVFMAFLSMSTGYLMTIGAAACKERAFVALGSSAFGSMGGKAAALLMMTQTFFTLTSYLVISMRSLCINYIIFIPLIVILVVPLCVLKDLGALKMASYLSCAIYFAVIPTVLYYCFQSLDSSLDAKNAALSSEAVNWFAMPGQGHLNTFPFIIFGFTCQHTILPLYESLSTPTEPRMFNVIKWSFVFVWGLYFTVGVAGHVAFRGYPRDVDIIFECLPQDAKWTRTLKSFFILAILLGYPCLHFGARKAWTYMLFGADAEFSWPKHLGVTALIVTITMTTALNLSILNLFMAWAGATTQLFLMLFFPCVCFLKFHSKLSEARNTPANVYLAKGVFALASVFFLVCVVNNIRGTKRLLEKPAACSMLFDYDFFARFRLN